MRKFWMIMLLFVFTLGIVACDGATDEVDESEDPTSDQVESDRDVEDVDSDVDVEDVDEDEEE